MVLRKLARLVKSDRNNPAVIKDILTILTAYPMTTNKFLAGYIKQLKWLIKSYVVQTLSKVIQRCLLMTTDPGDLVLDPTCGSGTTAYVRRAVGPPVDYRSKLPASRLALDPCPHHGRTLPLLLAGSDSRDGQVKQAEIERKATSESPGLWRHPPGIRVRAGTAYYPPGDCQQRGDRCHLGGRPRGLGTPQRGAEPRAWRIVGGVGDPPRIRRPVA